MVKQYNLAKLISLYRAIAIYPANRDLATAPRVQESSGTPINPGIDIPSGTLSSILKQAGLK